MPKTKQSEVMLYKVFEKNFISKMKQS